MMDLRQPEDLRQLRPRLQGMVLIVLLAFIALLSRLCQLQVLEGEHYMRRAERNFIETIEARQGFKVACLEEIAFNKGFIDAAQLERLGRAMKNPYGQYLLELLESA